MFARSNFASSFKDTDLRKSGSATLSIWWTGYCNLTYIHSLNDQNMLLRPSFRTNLKPFQKEVFVYAFVVRLIWVLGGFITFLFFFPMWPCLGSALGGVPSPFDCFLCNRGLKTLHLRMERHFKNAMAAAKYLEADERVERVIFPGDVSAV